ncbi:MAG: HEAT repeat domain-containing protein [Deltaproteobacteria bacterium]|nr:HEAT repeat domain-containing protein [Deltaproteobacteria bacterium]
MRALAVFTACWLLLSIGSASADSIKDSIRQLGTDPSQRVRLAAALNLSKERDPRAVIALAGSLRNDADNGIRRVSALALAKMIDARTAPDAVQLAFTALDDAMANDRSADVSAAAANALRSVGKFRPVKASRTPKKKGSGPPVFVNVDTTIDQSKQLPAGGGARLEKILKDSVQRTGYATTWPGGGMPTGADLESSSSRGFIVATTVKKIQITKTGSQTEISCTVAVRIAPWTGKDGGERWEANRAASASGSAKATVGNSPRMVNNGVNDCIEAVAENVTQQQVVPFLKRLASTN